MLYLDEEQVRTLLQWDELIPAMEKALAEFSLGRVVQPVRNMLTVEEGKRYLGIMPAVARNAAFTAMEIATWPESRNGRLELPVRWRPVTAGGVAAR